MWKVLVGKSLQNVPVVHSVLQDFILESTLLLFYINDHSDDFTCNIADDTTLRIIIRPNCGSD